MNYCSKDPLTKILQILDKSRFVPTSSNIHQNNPLLSASNELGLSLKHCVRDLDRRNNPIERRYQPPLSKT